MVAAAIVLFALGSASAFWGIGNAGEFSAVAQFVGFVSLTLSAILLLLGLPSTRKLVG
jgi:hypothetical protein